jgi:hypothetical protein
MRRSPTHKSQRNYILFFVLLLAGCAGVNGPQAPNAVTPFSETPLTHKSWTLPQAAQSQTLLYVATYRGYSVDIYDYKKGIVGQLFGQTGNFGTTGMCSDKSGNVWIANGVTVTEYAHGGTTPLRTKRDIKGEPTVCAVDPSTGDLAVAVYHDDSNYGMLTSVRIFGKNRRGGNFSIYNGFGAIWSLAYDNQGNLFADGIQCGASECYAYYEPALFELQKYSKTFEQVDVKGASLVDPSSLAWINPTLLLTDNSSAQPVGYKLSIQGQTATVVGTLSFSAARSVGYVAVRAGEILVPDQETNGIYTYNVKTGALDSTFSIQKPFAVVISQKGK